MQKNIDEQPSPQPNVKFGDWVEVQETIDDKNTIHHVLIESINKLSDGTFNINFYKWYAMVFDKSMTYRQYDLNNPDSIYKYQILRKLDHSEVKVSITLTGTVEKAFSVGNEFRLRYGDVFYDYSVIDFAHLTELDRDLVKSLLDEMREDK